MIRHFSIRPILIIPVLLACLATNPALTADSAGPSVYGRFNVSLNHSDHQGAMQVTSGTAIADTETVNHQELKSNSSNFGIRGTTAMDTGDLELIYQAELGIDIDGKGKDILSQRNTFIGFQHRQYGTLRAGRFDTPFKKAENVDQFNNILGDMDVLIGGQNRLSNIVQYTTPTLATNLVAHAAIVLAENDHDNGEHTPNGLSTSLVYYNDRIFAALAYDRNITARRSVDGITVNSNAVRAVIKLTFEHFETGLVLQQNRDSDDDSDLQDDAALINAAWRTDRLKIKVQHGQSRGKKSREKGRLNVIGADYHLSRRTFLFSYYARLEMAQSQLRDDTLAIGLQHSF